MTQHTARSVILNLFFWTFNASLLLIVYVGFLPFIGTGFLQDVFTGQVPFDFLLPFIGLVGVPTSSAVVGAIPKLRQSSVPQSAPISLFQFFYSVEAPLLLVCVARFFWLRDLTPGATLLLITGTVATIAHLHWLRHGRASESNTTGWHLAGHTLMLAMSLYLAAIVSFYIIPLIVAILYQPGSLLFALILVPLTLVLVGLWTAPFGMVGVYLQAWIQSMRQLSCRHSFWTKGLAAIVLLIWLGSFLFLQQPSYAQAFTLLEKPASTESQRQELLQNKSLIRRGLLDAYLAPYRYPRSLQDRHIYNLYFDFLHFPEPIAQSLQTVYNVLLAPFSYNGNPYEDADKASQRYAQFFDTPILRAELPVIENAIQSTFDRRQAKAGLADINARRVWLAEQQVNVTPHGDWAEVELYEVYENQTFEQQEVLYYFSLPESAVLTGLWLGETNDRAMAFPYVLAPRGAAQQVYTEEVNRQVDPALLEQVGPRTYRLRAFPVLPVGQANMHLWFTYKVLKQETGWAMPTLLERRNLFWTNNTQRQVNHESVQAKDQWLPASLPANAAQPKAHQLPLAWGGTVLGTPLTEAAYQLPQNKRFAVILDGSYSMDAHRQEVAQTVQWLKEQVLPQNTADLYLTTMPPLQPQRLDGFQDFEVDKAQFYGTLQPREMLQQFLDLQDDRPYDAVLLMTDSGSYELSTDSDAVLSMPAPLWLVHLGGLQFAYDDATVQAIQQSGGSATTQIEEVMYRLGTQPTQGNGSSLLNVVDGYAWFLTENPDPTVTVDESFSPIAARQWVAHLSEYVKPNQLAQLDTIHAVTKDYNIVTPHSSMIVLVNDAQRQRLRELEQGDDRFNREIEDQQALPQPSTLEAADLASPSAVPEPAEWLLILVSAIGLGWVYSRREQELWQRMEKLKRSSLLKSITDELKAGKLS